MKFPLCSQYPTSLAYFGNVSTSDRMLSGLRDNNSTQTCKSTKRNILTYITGKDHGWIQPLRCHQESLSHHLFSPLSCSRASSRGALPRWQWHSHQQYQADGLPAQQTPEKEGVLSPNSSKTSGLTLLVWLRIHAHLQNTHSSRA